MLVKAKFVKYSICPCGFPVLDTKIEIGTVYTINPKRKDRFVFVCGGCHQVLRVVGVWAARGKERGGFLPEQIFEIIK